MATAKYKREMIMEYIVELNCPIGKTIIRAAKYLQRRGIHVEFLPHKTSLRLFRPAQMRWREFAKILAGSVEGRTGSVLMFSIYTGYAYIYRNGGNRPGKLLKIAY